MFFYTNFQIEIRSDFTILISKQNKTDSILFQKTAMTVEFPRNIQSYQYCDFRTTSNRNKLRIVTK